MWKFRNVYKCLKGLFVGGIAKTAKELDCENCQSKECLCKEVK